MAMHNIIHKDMLNFDLYESRGLTCSVYYTPLCSRQSFDQRRSIDFKVVKKVFETNSGFFIFNNQPKNRFRKALKLQKYNSCTVNEAKEMGRY